MGACPAVMTALSDHTPAIPVSPGRARSIHSPLGHGAARVMSNSGPPARGASCLITALAVAGCSVDAPDLANSPAPTPIVVSVTATPPPVSTTVYALGSPALHVHAAPDLQAAVVGNEAQVGAMTVVETRQMDSGVWLHVTADSQTAGWVLDRPDLVIHRPVKLVPLGDGYSILVPAEWPKAATSPLAFAAPNRPGALARTAISIRAGPDPARLGSVPSAAAKEVKALPVVVDGQDATLIAYSLDRGNYELDVKVQFVGTNEAFLFRLDLPGGPGLDDAIFLFAQLLASVNDSGAG